MCFLADLAKIRSEDESDTCREQARISSWRIWSDSAKKVDPNRTLGQALKQSRVTVRGGLRALPVLRMKGGRWHLTSVSREHPI